MRISFSTREAPYRGGIYEVIPGGLYREEIFVAANRDVATEFAKDIARGPLDVIYEALQKRRTETENALSVIEGTAAGIRESKE